VKVMVCLALGCWKLGVNRLVKPILVLLSRMGWLVGM